MKAVQRRVETVTRSFSNLEVIVSNFRDRTGPTGLEPFAEGLDARRHLEDLPPQKPDDWGSDAMSRARDRQDGFTLDANETTSKHWEIAEGLSCWLRKSSQFFASVSAIELRYIQQLNRV